MNSQNITTSILLALVVGWGRASGGRVAFANARGVHSGVITRRADAAISESHLLVEIGSDAEHIDVCDAAGDIPLGVVNSEVEAAEDHVGVSLLGGTGSTLLARSGGAVSAGDYLTTNGDGKAVALPASAGTYYIVGRALQDASAGELVEFDPCVPVQRVVS